MIYYRIDKKQDGLWLSEPSYAPEYNKKTESVFTQCNGYLGVRAAAELRQLEEKRGTFLNGFYHQAGPHEVTELVNCPDVTRFTILVNGKELFPDRLPMEHYIREFHIETGELHIQMVFATREAGLVTVDTRRFVSKAESALLCHQISIQCERSARIELTTGIDGQINNGGISHFEKSECRVFENSRMYLENTCDDGQRIQILTELAEGETVLTGSYFLERRGIYGKYTRELEAGVTWKLAKYTMFAREETDAAGLQEQMRSLTLSYAGNREAHQTICRQFWEMARIQIQGATLEEEAAIAFAQYHMSGMVPWHTDTYSAGAKGLTGEGYKGHVFWDTELFIMPMFILMFPEVAENLLQYRYQRLAGAKRKAREYGYQGAMYPWESAGTGEEETPLYAAMNIHTGEATKVWSGIKEHHVTADIIYGLLQYCRAAKSDTFLTRYGSEMILETAKFWYSRAVWVKEKKRYEIRDIIGPDEYTEHIDNNAYTNYMAYFNIKAALEGIFIWETPLAMQCRAEGWEERWKHFLTHLYLPTANEEGLIPQDDTFLEKKELINIEKYKNAKKKQLILTEYSRKQVIGMQVLKQADVVMLLNLFPAMFEKEVVKKNVEFYEARTIHDSSLSLCAHAQAMAQIGEMEKALEFFHKAMEIDLCDNCEDTTDGVHAASMGGILNCVLGGFAGLQIGEQGITFIPRLPEHWKSMTFFIWEHGKKKKVLIDRERSAAVMEEAE